MLPVLARRLVVSTRPLASASGRLGGSAVGKSFDDVIAAMEAGEAINAANREAATAAHELFLVLLSGGFTEDQALKIIAYRMAFDADNEE